MIQQTQNSFTGGMLSVLPPEGTPNSVLTDCLNGAIISYAGKEFTLQKRPGNIKIEDINFNSYIPIAAKERGGVIYFVLKNNNWAALGYYSELNQEVRGNKFKLLQNLKKVDADNLDFITDELQLSNNIELELQDSYDGSINLIITDNENPPLLINSGFTFNNGVYQDTAYINNTYYNAGKVYSQSTLLKTIQTLARCQFVRSDDGGNLPVGNYTFFFKYTDLDGNETDIFCETGAISIHLGSDSLGIGSILGGQYKENSNKNIQLRLYNLDRTYSRVKVYYSVCSSDTQETPFTEIYEIADAYDFTADVLNVIITGNENRVQSTEEAINISSQKINSAKCAIQCNGHLLLGNQTKENFHSDDLKRLAQEIILSERNERNIGWITIDDTKASGVNLIKTSSDFMDLLMSAAEEKATGIYLLVNDIEVDTAVINQYFTKTQKRVFRGRLDGNGKSIAFKYNGTTNNSLAIYLFDDIIDARIENIRLVTEVTGQTAKLTTSLDVGIPLYAQWGLANNVSNSTVKNVTLRTTFYAKEINAITQRTRVYFSPIIWAANSTFEDIDIKSHISLAITQPNSTALKEIEMCGFIARVGPNCTIKKVSSRYTGDLTKVSGNFTRDKLYINLSSLTCSADSTSIIDSAVFHLVEHRLNGGLQPDPNMIVHYILGTAKSTNTVAVTNACNVWVGGTALPDKMQDKHLMTTLATVNGYDALEPKYYEHLFSKDMWAMSVKYGMYLYHNSGDEGGLEEEVQQELEYYSNKNLYNYLGYWPDEYYRFGIVFIDKFGSLSPVYNIKGNIASGREFGVYKTSTTSTIKITPNGNQVSPIGLVSYTSQEVIDELKIKGVVGYFFVRQKRLPTVIGQGLCISRDQDTGIPLVSLGAELHYAEAINSPSSSGNKLNTTDVALYVDKIDKTKVTKGGCILSPDLSLNSERNGPILNGGNFKLQLNSVNNKTNELTRKSRVFTIGEFAELPPTLDLAANLLYIPENCVGLSVNGKLARTTTGDPNLKSSCVMINKPKDNKYSEATFIRGEYTSFIAAEYKTANSVTQSRIVNIRLSSYDDITNNATIRANDNSPYFAICDRLSIDELRTAEPMYRGDCFIANYTVRLNKNFLGKETPFQSGIVETNMTFDSDIIKNEVLQEKDFEKVNTADMNAVKIGTWVSFKCCSNVNHIYRCVDSSNLQEMALFNQKGDGSNSTGGARKFYPHVKMSVDPWNKLLDSTVINSGYSRTDSVKGYFDLNKLIFSREQFHTRVSYSNKHIASSFENNYRNFHPLAYKDYPTNMGQIVTMRELFGNVILVFENGVGIIPIQERVLAGSGLGGEVFINSGEVLPDKPIILSDRFGCGFSQCVVQGNVALYGVDFLHKKIWRTDGKSFEVISDFKVHDILERIMPNISFNDLLSHTIAPFACAHFDKVTGDVLFSFMDPQNQLNESIVYNEISSLWVSRTSLAPYLSVNLKEKFISFKYNDPNLIVPNQTTAWMHKAASSAIPGSFFNQPYDFEFEFVVHADKPHIQKIFNNLRIVSNNVCPDEIDYTITPDSFWGSCESFKNAVMIGDEITVRQVCLDMRQVGRVRGNTMFKENIWHLQIPNIIVDTLSGREKGAKLRDKWIKIRVRYKSTAECFGKLPLIKSIITNYIESQS